MHEHTFYTISSTSVIIGSYEFTFYWYDDFTTQLPFELKLTMPPTDRGGRGYSDEFVAKAQKELKHPS